MVWGRVMTSINAGWKAARATWSTYNTIGGAMPGPSSADWDDYKYRQQRYAIFESYYSNDVYFNSKMMLLIQKQRPQLYKHIRGIYNPFYRLVKLYEATVYPGVLDIEQMRSGSLPIIMADDNLREALRRVWMWSAWNRNKSLYVRNGAKLADSFIKVVDDPVRQKVRMEVIDPRKVAEVKLDANLNIKAVVIEYEDLDDQGRQYTYTETIDKDAFRTFKDGQPHGYVQDADGNPVPEWQNDYGFVPMVLAQHSLTGRMFGENAVPRAVLEKIDIVNDLASVLHGQVRKAINVVWYLAGTNASDLVVDVSDEKKLPTVTGPVGSSATPMIAPLDIASVSAEIKDRLAEIERDLPVLSLSRIREQQQATAPGTRAAFADAEWWIQAAQANYDGPLIAAQQMAVAIGGYRGYDGFDGYGLDSYDAGALEHYIGERPLFQDSLSRNERLNHLSSAGASLRLQLEEMDYPQDVIDQEVETELAEQAAAARGFAQEIFGGVTNGGTANTEAQPDGAGGSAGEAGAVQSETGG